MITYAVSFVLGIAMGLLQGFLMRNALASPTSFFVSTLLRHVGLIAALFILKRAINLDFVSWGFGFFPALWYYALTKQRGKPDEVRDI